jgi:hypothetical protein|tara:strand:- start:27940 stop:28452 length:513 start_codon:yes stop_codon:yes gene_type:complete
MINKLIALANQLDVLGHPEDASSIDRIIKRYSSYFGDPNKPEREKYLDTLMADMGLTSLDELSPEERRRFIAAARPQPIVEQKLKDMGHKIAQESLSDTPITMGYYNSHIRPFITQEIQNNINPVSESLSAHRKDIDRIDNVILGLTGLDDDSLTDEEKKIMEERGRLND